jgi:VCBS repeat-containing protein
MAVEESKRIGVDNGVRPARVDRSIATIAAADVDGTVSYDAGALIAAGWSTSNLGATYTHAATYGTATLNTTTNQVTFALNNSAADVLTPSDHPTQDFTVAVKDNLGATASTSVTFTIDGSNDAGPASPTLLVAYTEVNGSPGYQDGADSLIVKIDDTDGDHGISVGDKVTCGKFPLSVDDPNAGIYGNFTELSGVVTLASVGHFGNGNEAFVRVGSHSDLYFISAPFFVPGDTYVDSNNYGEYLSMVNVGTLGYENVALLDSLPSLDPSGYDSPFSDLIQAGPPYFEVSTFLPNLTNDPFLNIDWMLS